MTKRFLLSAVILAVMAGVAEAHPEGGHAAGFIHGFIHPLSGWDHITAMISVGFFAASLGGRAKWLVPSAFVTMMVAGGAWAMAGMPLPFVESGILASVFVLAGVALLRWNAPLLGAMALCGFFAVFHGYAHGLEMPEDAAGITFASGFILATAILHGAGLVAGAIATHIWPRPVVKA